MTPSRYRPINLNGKPYDLEDVINIEWDGDDYESYREADTLTIELESGDVEVVEKRGLDQDTRDLLSRYVMSL